MNTMSKKTHERRIVLAPWQLSAIASLGLVVVPVRDLDHAIDGALFKSNGDEVACPYMPGDVLWVAERYSPCACLACGTAWPKRPAPDSVQQWPHPVIYQTPRPGASGVLFRPAVTMPAWAARHRLKALGVEARRVQSVTEDEAIKIMGGRGAGIVTARGHFQEAWTTRHGSKFPFDTSWAWLVKVEACK